MKIAKWFLLLSIISMVFAQMPNPLLEHAEYEIWIGSEKSGFHIYSLEPYEMGWKLESTTFMRMKIDGSSSEVRYHENTILNTDFTPNIYQLSLESGGIEHNMTAVFEADSVAIDIMSTKEDGIKHFSMLLDGDTHILDNSMFDHFIFFIKKLDPEKPKPIEFAIFAPQLRQKGYLTLNPGGDTNFRGRKAMNAKVNYLGLDAELKIEKETRRMLEVNIPLHQIRAIYTEKLDTTEIKLAAFSELIANGQLFVESNIRFDRPYDVIQMTADVNATLTGTELLKTRYQSFEGTYKDNIVNGTFTITSDKYSGSKSGKVPIENFPREYSKYLLSTKEFPAKDSMISLKAYELAGKEKNSWEISKSIVNYVYYEIEYEFTDGSAKHCFVNKKGDSKSKSYLAVSMLRALKIPSRVVGGLLYTNAHFGPHYWVEVYLGEKAGWIPVDPSTGEHESFSAIHINLWESNDKPGKLNHSVPYSVEITDNVLKERKK